MVNTQNFSVKIQTRESWLTKTVFYDPVSSAAIKSMLTNNTIPVHQKEIWKDQLKQMQEGQQYMSQTYSHRNHILFGRVYANNPASIQSTKSTTRQHLSEKVLVQINY